MHRLVDRGDGRLVEMLGVNVQTNVNPVALEAEDGLSIDRARRADAARAESAAVAINEDVGMRASSSRCGHW